MVAWVLLYLGTSTNPASTADWVTAWASLGLVVVAIVGFGLTVYTLIQARNRQRVDVEGYVRIDIGPPEGTTDFTPPTNLAHIEDGHLSVLGDAVGDSPSISVWYRNMQTHPLGIALGIVGTVAFELIDPEGRLTQLSQTHEIAYLEPGKCVRVDAVRFPADWVVAARVEGTQYRNLDWDGQAPRHGRRECYYDGEFYMVPWSDPRNSTRDLLARSLEAVTKGAKMGLRIAMRMR